MARVVTEVNMNGADVAKMKGAELVYKLPIPVHAEFAKSAGEIQTRETTNPAPHVAGDVILTGPGGERWPIPRSKFDSTYKPVEGQEMGVDGQYVKAKVEVWAVQMDKPFNVTVDWQDVHLHGKKGDYLVRYGENDYGVVGKEIFKETYAKAESSEKELAQQIIKLVNGIMADLNEHQKLVGADPRDWWQRFIETGKGMEGRDSVRIIWAAPTYGMDEENPGMKEYWKKDHGITISTFTYTGGYFEGRFEDVFKADSEGNVKIFKPGDWITLLPGHAKWMKEQLEVARAKFKDQVKGYSELLREASE